MHAAFEYHILNEEGKLKAQEIAKAFNDLLVKLGEVVPEGRERSICVTKLEEACFFAKKAMAKANAA